MQFGNNAKNNKKIQNLTILIWLKKTDLQRVFSGARANVTQTHRPELRVS